MGRNGRIVSVVVDKEQVTCVQDRSPVQFARLTTEAVQESQDALWGEVPHERYEHVVKIVAAIRV